LCGEIDMPTESLKPVTTTSRPWQPRFSIRALLLLMLVASGMSSAGYYFVQMLRGGRNHQLAFILFTVASPLLLLVGASIAVALLRRSGRRR
jgi:hypothetical protein